MRLLYSLPFLLCWSLGVEAGFGNMVKVEIDLINPYKMSVAQVTPWFCGHGFTGNCSAALPSGLPVSLLVIAYQSNIRINHQYQYLDNHIVSTVKFTPIQGTQVVVDIDPWTGKYVSATTTLAGTGSGTVDRLGTYYMASGRDSYVARLLPDADSVVASVTVDGVLQQTTPTQSILDLGVLKKTDTRIVVTFGPRTSLSAGIQAIITGSSHSSCILDDFEPLDSGSTLPVAVGSTHKLECKTTSPKIELCSLEGSGSTEQNLQSDKDL